MTPTIHHDSLLDVAQDHPSTTVEDILEAVISVLAGELAKVGRFEWRGFGTFTVRTYPARKTHNPATGKTIALPARKSITWPGPDIRVTRGKVARTSLLDDCLSLVERQAAIHVEPFRVAGRAAYRKP